MNDMAKLIRAQNPDITIRDDHMIAKHHAAFDDVRCYGLNALKDNIAMSIGTLGEFRNDPKEYYLVAELCEGLAGSDTYSLTFYI